MASEEKKRKVAAQTGLYLIVIVGIAILANMLSAGAYSRADLTRNDRYTLSKGSARLVSELKEPVRVDAYVKKGLAHLDAFVRDLTDLLKEYERNGGGKFKYTIIEPNTDELREKAKEEGLQEQPFGEANATADDTGQLTMGYMGLVFKYGSEKIVWPMNPSQRDGLEFWITNKIREIRDKNDDIKHRIAVITGKEELKLSDTNLVARQGRGGAPSLKSIIDQAFPFYTVEELDLKDGAEPIDKELEGLIITQPQKEYTEKELRRIDEFLMLGNKSLAVFVSAATMKPNDASMSAELKLHGLDKLLLGYGLDVKKNVVFDHGAQLRMQMLLPPAQVARVRHPGMAQLVDDPRFAEDERLLDTSFPGFFRIEQLVFPYPSSIQLLRDKQPSDVELKAVARTTPVASVETGESVDLKLNQEWKVKEPTEQRIIAAIAQGKLKSAFAGKPSDEIKSKERAPHQSRVLVVASGQFLTNPFAYAGNGPELGGQFQMFGGVGGDQQLQMLAGPYAQNFLTGTILAMKNTLDWMSGDADLIAASAKILGEPNLTYASLAKPKYTEEATDEQMRKQDEQYRDQRKELQQKVQWSLTLGVPFLFAGFGLFRWNVRQSKKQRTKAKG
jgi:ABC-type uncharacterized transport system involved in gliding motility auxiliary subunit